MGQLKTFLVVNPHSANGATGRHFGRILQAVRAAIGEFDCAQTRAPMDATALTRQALRAGFECVVAVGGDGTVNEVVNGFWDEGRPVREGAALGVIPCGTGGDLRRSLGWSTDLAEAAARLQGDRCRALDLGHIEFALEGGERQSRYFVNIASAGVSGQVDWEVNHASKVLGGRASFLLGTFKAMLKHHDVPIRFALDDGPFQPAMATVIAVANGQYFGGGMWVAPDARPDDGLFDITLWSGYRLLDFALKSRAIYNGRHVQLHNTRRFRASRVKVESDAPGLLDIDGEQPGRLPASFAILPGALRVRVASRNS